MRGRWFDAVSFEVGTGQGKAAFTTSRRVSRAVDRNSIKRRLREAYRLEQREPSTLIVVFIGSEKVLKMAFATLRGEMRRVLNQLSSQDLR